MRAFTVSTGRELHYPKKVYPLVFDNDFGKCGPILKILSPTD